jgi:DNA helicase HerA-like ATPase
MLAELYENLPEVGDPDKPKLVFFFDEAHLLFADASKALEEKIEQVVRLIHSKGVGVYFVTRMKDNAPYEVVGEKEVPRNRSVLKDGMIELRGPKAIEKSPCPLRRIEIYYPETEEYWYF